MKALVAITAFALLAATVAADDPPVIDADSVFTLRDSLARLTPEPRRVSMRLAMMCAMASPDAVDAEVERAGPHAGAWVNYYVSADAVAAMGTTDSPLAVGTIVLKEKLDVEDAEAIAVGGMVKRAPGFDPENGDWEYFYGETGGEFAMGRLQNCAGCHARARAVDFVFFRAAQQ